MDSHEKTENRLYFPTVLVLHDNIQQGISFKPGTAYFGRVGGRHHCAGTDTLPIRRI
jgi:hypothetical protein